MIINLTNFIRQFFCCLLLVLTAEIAAGAWGYYNNDKLEVVFKNTIKHTVSHEYGQIPSRTFAFDSFQQIVRFIKKF